MREMATEIKKLTPARLTEALGVTAAAKLMELFGGRTIPKRSRFHLEHTERDRAIRAAAVTGDYKAVALEFDLSERQVRRIAHPRRTPTP